MTIQGAKTRLQVLVKDVSVNIRNAPDQPITNADALPLSLVYLSSGEGIAVSSSQLTFFPTIRLDVHFPRTFLKQIHADIDTVAVEIMRRLAGDPTLNSSVDTIVFPVSFSVDDDIFDEVETKKIGFEIPVKTLESPVTV